jgi:pyruvate formate lyase activating enzyme
MSLLVIALEAMLWDRLDSCMVKCRLCGWRCTIPDGGRGKCAVRENRGGTLYTLVYGKAASYAVDPIEKKPLYHFHPGSSAFSVATVGCNFRCTFCDNWMISQQREIQGDDLPPERIVEMAKQAGCEAVSYTYTEPTIFFEYAYDTAKLAHREGLYNTFVTNGYMTLDAIDTIDGYLDAATIDFKGSADPGFYKKFCGTVDVSPLFQALLEMNRRKIHLEITNLIVPEGGDAKEPFIKLVRWIKDELGDDTPFHILKFFRQYKFDGPDTVSGGYLEELWKAAKDLGLNYVYLGNVHSPKYSDTYCPTCGRAVISREGFGVSSIHLKGTSCAYCGGFVNVII